MSESIRIADHLWSEAESLVDRIEHASQVETCEQSVYDAVTSELLPVANAIFAELWITDRDTTRTLSRSGVSVAAGSNAPSGIDRSATSVGQSNEGGGYEPPRAKWHDGLQLIAKEQISLQTIIGLTLKFDRAVDGTLSGPLCEISESLLSLASGVYLRHRFTALTTAIDSQTHRDRVLSQLNDGANLHESLAIIAGTVASETTADRVTILQIRGQRGSAISSSTQPRIDRRARQVRLLESLAGPVSQLRKRFHFAVGSEDNEDHSPSPQQAALNAYLAESGSREIQIEPVAEQAANGQSGDTIGAIVLERFRLDDSAGGGGFAKFDQLRDPTFSALRRAFHRDLIGWSVIAPRLIGSRPAKRLAWLLVISLLVIAALSLIPGELKIPVDGRLVATKHQRLYAPANGVISILHVSNDELVDAGAPLIRIRSASLDQQQRQLEGTLATTKSRLAAVTASKSRPSTTPTIDRSANPNPLASANEKVLKTEIDALETQLELIAQQQRELTLLSPIQGYIDRWGLQQSHAGRPVVHGQYLLDVVSNSEGWTVELDIPDAQSQFVLDAQAQEPCPVVFRLRSNPDTAYDGKLEYLSGVTQFDPSGRPIMRATLHINHRDELRNGATVIAYVHCGSRPLGFIWFRSLIGWVRQIDWF